MKTFAHYLTDGKESCGSDSWSILDSRNTLNNHIAYAMKRIEQLKKIHRYNGFQIREGSAIDKNRIVYSKIIELIN